MSFDICYWKFSVSLLAMFTSNLNKICKQTTYFNILFFFNFYMIYVLTWKLPAFVKYFTPLKGLYLCLD